MFVLPVTRLFVYNRQQALCIQVPAGSVMVARPASSNQVFFTISLKVHMVLDCFCSR